MRKSTYLLPVVVVLAVIALSSIDHLPVDVIAQLLLQDIADHPEGVALVVVHQVFDILQEKRLRPMMADNLGQPEEQRALGIAGEAVWPVQRILLGHARDGKRLTREARQQHVMRGDVLNNDIIDVGGNLMLVTKVGAVGLLAVFVALAGEHTASPDGLEAVSQTSDSCEQVDEGEIRRPVVAGLHQGLQGLDDRLAGFDFPGFPAIGRALTESCTHGRLGHTQPSLLPQL